jgi:hypothetical protein
MVRRTETHTWCSQVKVLYQLQKTTTAIELQVLLKHMSSHPIPKEIPQKGMLCRTPTEVPHIYMSSYLTWIYVSPATAA